MREADVASTPHLIVEAPQDRSISAAPPVLRVASHDAVEELPLRWFGAGGGGRGELLDLGV